MIRPGQSRSRRTARGITVLACDVSLVASACSSDPPVDTGPIGDGGLGSRSWSSDRLGAVTSGSQALWIGFAHTAKRTACFGMPSSRAVPLVGNRSAPRVAVPMVRRRSTVRFRKRALVKVINRTTSNGAGSQSGSHPGLRQSSSTVTAEGASRTCSRVTSLPRRRRALGAHRTERSASSLDWRI
jgi:hypothetical protein